MAKVRSKNRVLTLCAVAIVYSAQLLTAQPVLTSSEYRFQHFGMNDGLASESAAAIVQDSIGFLWILHDNGLSRYDGYNFKVYKHNPKDSLGPGPPLDGFLELDKHGNLWVISNPWIIPDHSIILTRHDSKKDNFIKYFPDLKGVLVRSIEFDRDDTTVWIGTWGKGLYSFNRFTGETKHYLNNYSDSARNYAQGSWPEQRNTIFGMVDQDSIVLLATWRGLWKFHKGRKTFSHPTCQASDAKMVADSPIVEIFKSQYSADLFLATHPNGLIKVRDDFSEKSSVLFDTLDASRHRSFFQDKNGILWLADKNNGLYRYDPHVGKLDHLRARASDSYSLRSNRLTGLIIDRDQNVWVTTQDRGISKLPSKDLIFYNYDFRGEVTGKAIFNTTEKSYLIVGQSKRSQEGDNEILFAPFTNKLGSFIFKKVILKRKIEGKITQMMIGKNHLWIATFGEHGVVGLPIDSSSILSDRAEPQFFVHDSQNPNTINAHPGDGGQLISGLWQDSQENLWVGTYGAGLSKVNLNIAYGKEGSVVRYTHSADDTTSLSSDVIWWEFYPEKNGFWLITAFGLDLFRNGLFEHYFKNDYVATVKRISDGTLIVGTSRGLYESADKDNFRFKKHSSKILSEMGAYAFEEDKSGRLWISTHGRIQCYDRRGNSVATFSGLEGLDYARDWIEKTSDGIFVTADAHGISLFDPTSFIMSQRNVTPVFTSLSVNNQGAVASDKIERDDGFTLWKDISVLDQLELDHKHNHFTIEFSAMEMTSPEKNLYRYQLEGYDEDWIETDYKDRSATYTNLEAGNYVFKVRASNYHGVWSDVETTLLVTILPPPWKTWWAYSLYVVALIVAIVFWRDYEVKRVKLKHRAEHLAEVDQLKSRFFANISHEFRTPITLVLGPLRDLYNQLSNPEQKNILGSVIRNGQRLQRLINQLLDLSKVEAGKMKLHASHLDMVELLRGIASSYESLAKEKNIRYFFYPEVKELPMYVDEEKIEKIIHNLLSNAFKFTNEGGEIISNLRTVANSAIISVTDSGIGIPEDQRGKIFDRFYQVDNSQTRAYEGTGLGLALVKDLVDLHYGKISVDSKEGKGTTFNVSLPLGKDHLQKEEVVERRAFEKTEFTSAVVMSGNVGAGGEKEPENQSETVLVRSIVLIVEDNADMRQYIRKTLLFHYQIIEAANGRDGLEQAEQAMPDLIISDIMMPEMDGYKLCSTIKSKEMTSHIPVILLTAKADRESKLSGLEIGADDYLAKPFDADELKLIVRNRIEERRKMREHFSRAITLEPTHVAITSLDEKFITKVLAMIERHMDDEDFSIEDFSQEAGYSRMQFYRKIKGLTNQTPSQFVRSIRLKRAAQLLLAKSDNVSQIAYRVGFGSLAYFNKCFKEQFGIAPGQYAEATQSRVKS